IRTAVALGITGLAWTFFAVYQRRDRQAAVVVHLGWIGMLAGMSFGYWRRADAPHWSGPFLIMGLLLQGVYWFYRFILEARHSWVGPLLTHRIRSVLMWGSVVLA